MVSYNWNAPGSAFLQSSDSVVEEMLVLLFQPATCRTDNVPPTSKLPLCIGDLDPLLVVPWAHIPNGIFIGSAVFVWLKIMIQWPSDRHTGRPHYSTCNSRPQLHSSEMRPNNKLCNIVVTDGTNQSHNINEIYYVHLYQSTNFLNAPVQKWTYYYLMLSYVHCTWMSQ